jgi:hypothetical protein
MVDNCNILADQMMDKDLAYYNKKDFAANERMGGAILAL